MPTPHACIKGVPGVCAGQGPRIRRTSRSWPRSPAQLCGVPSPLRALHPTHSELGGAAKPHTEAPHSRSAAAASGVPSGPRSTCASRSWVAGCGDPGMRATRSPRLPPPGLLPPRATGLQSYSFPRCHGNFLLLIRTKHPPLLAPVGSP